MERRTKRASRPAAAGWSRSRSRRGASRLRRGAPGELRVVAVSLPSSPASAWSATLTPSSAPTLRETPETWKNVLRYEVGYGQIAIATALLGGPGGILVISFEAGEEAPAPVASVPPSAGPAPEIVVRTKGSRESSPRAASDSGSPTTRAQPRPGTARERARAVVLAVDIRNLRSTALQSGDARLPARCRGGGICSALERRPSARRRGQTARCPRERASIRRLSSGSRREPRCRARVRAGAERVATRIRVPIGDLG